MRRFRLLAAALATAAALAACDDDPSGPPAVDAVAVSTAADSLVVGGKMQMSLTLRDRSGAEVSGRAVAWSSDNPAVAAVDSAGLVTARAMGTATITATSEGKSAGVALRVVAVPVQTVDMGLTRLSLYAGQTVQLSAVARDAAGQPLPGRTFLWATDDSTIASVTQTGLVTVKRAGQVGVSALTGGVYSIVRLELYATKGYVWPDTLALLPGGTRTLQARSVSLRGAPMQLDSAKWESANPSVVRVDSITGAVTAVGNGQALVTARLGTTRLSSVVYVKSYGQLRFTSMGVGSGHGCGLVADGTAYCWGSGMVAQLGTEEPTSRCEIVNADIKGSVYRGTYRCSPHPVPVGGGLRFTEISVGSDRTCGVTSDGSVYCWGGSYAVNYDFGPPPPSFVLAPVRVQSPVPLRSVRVNGLVACGLSEAGAAYCWGSNTFGALGNGSTTDSQAAVRVSGGLTFTSLTAGGLHACGLTPDGAAYCWGRGDSGQLGSAPTGTCTTSYQAQIPCSTSPARVSGDVRFSAIRAADDFTCGLDGAGRAYCWGSGAQGRLGNGTMQGSPTPVAVQGGLAFQSVSLGSGRACGLVGGASYCWGTNVPQGGNSQYANPAPVRALPSFALRTVEVGSSQDCGIGADGIAYCWSTMSAPAPVQGQ